MMKVFKKVIFRDFVDYILFTYPDIIYMYTAIVFIMKNKN